MRFRLLRERNALKSSHNFPHSVEYYLERAAECERLASGAVTEENREVLQQLAARWRAFAAQANRSPPDKG